jgi:phosphoglycerate-specific signal transduction histidine kinase
MDLKEYMRLKKQIEEKYQQEVHALELLWNNYGSKDSNLSDDHKKNVSESAREVIKALGDKFSVTEVAEGLKNLGHEDVSMPQLSNLMNRLSKRNEIAIVEKGKGRSPNMYQRMKIGEAKIVGVEDFL